MDTRRFIATTPVQFVRKISAVYLRQGYCQYKLLTIPEGKEAARVEQKLVDCYDITNCRTRRARRKQDGLANVIFVRYQRCIVLMATEGVQRQWERMTTYHFGTTPLHFDDYSIGLIRHRPFVRVREEIWREVVGRFVFIALKHPKPEMEQKIMALPYANFLGVRFQKIDLVTRVNHRRKLAGLPLVKLYQKPNRLAQSQLLA